MRIRELATQSGHPTRTIYETDLRSALRHDEATWLDADLG